MEQPAPTDRHLLARYAQEGSQAAFAILTERYLRLVYSTCYRELRNKELAEEATQAVFLELARKAKNLRAAGPLSAWLYTTARFKTSTAKRDDRRRRAREELAFTEAQMEYQRGQDEAWRSIEPALNDALGALSATDQEVLFLRFFEEKSLHEVGAAVGLSDDAAQKRVSRALEKLRAALVSRKAATISTVALAGLLTKHATYAVPAHLPAAVAQSVGTVPGLSTPPLLGAGGLRGGSALNPLLAKGLLIMSTKKIVASAVGLVILLLLATVGVSRLHQAGTGPLGRLNQAAAISRLPAVPAVSHYSVTRTHTSFSDLDKIRPPDGYGRFALEGEDVQGNVWGFALTGNPSRRSEGSVAAARGTKNGTSVYAVLPEGVSAASAVTNRIGMIVYAKIVNAQQSGINDWALFSFANGASQPIITIDNCAAVDLSDVNVNGDVVGSLIPQPGAKPEAFLVSHGKLTVLPKPPGANGSVAQKISDNGYIVGQAGIIDGTRTISATAWLYNHGDLINLPTLPGARIMSPLSVNDAGVVVGYSMVRGSHYVDYDPGEAWMYEKGRLVVLNTLIDPSLGYRLYYPDEITDHGQILCEAQKSNEPADWDKWFEVLVTPQ